MTDDDRIYRAQKAKELQDDEVLQQAIDAAFVAKLDELLSLSQDAPEVTIRAGLERLRALKDLEDTLAAYVTEGQRTTRPRMQVA